MLEGRLGRVLHHAHASAVHLRTQRGRHGGGHADFGLAPALGADSVALCLHR